MGLDNESGVSDFSAVFNLKEPFKSLYWHHESTDLPTFPGWSGD